MFTIKNYSFLLKDILYILDGSFDNGDPNTTNLYLGNLNPKVIFIILILIWLKLTAC